MFKYEHSRKMEVVAYSQKHLILQLETVCMYSKFTITKKKKE